MSVSLRIRILRHILHFQYKFHLKTGKSFNTHDPSDLWLSGLMAPVYSGALGPPGHARKGLSHQSPLLCHSSSGQICHSYMWSIQPVDGDYSGKLQHFVLAQWDRSQASNSLLKLFPSPLLITSPTWHLRLQYSFRESEPVQPQKCTSLPQWAAGSIPGI